MSPSETQFMLYRGQLRCTVDRAGSMQGWGPVIDMWVGASTRRQLRVTDSMSIAMWH